MESNRQSGNHSVKKSTKPVTLKKGVPRPMAEIKDIGMKEQHLSGMALLEQQLALIKCTESKAGQKSEQEKVEQEKLSTKVKKELSNSCCKCIDLKGKVVNFKFENLLLQKACSGHLKEIDELRKIIQEANQTIADLTHKLAPKEEPVNLLDEQIYFSAEQIEEFSRNQSPSKETSIVREVVNKKRNYRELDQSISTKGISRPMKYEERPIGYEINGRDIYDTRANVESAITLLQLKLRQRDMDVSSLKERILKERVEVKLLFEKKDTEYAEDILKVQRVLANTRAELDKSKERRKELFNKFRQKWSDKMLHIQFIFEKSREKMIEKMIEMMRKRTEKMKKHYENIANKRIEKMQAQLLNGINVHQENPNTTN